MTILQDINLYPFFSKTQLKLKKVSNHENKKSRSRELQFISIKKIRSEYNLSKSSYLTGHVFRKSFFKRS